MAMIIAGERSSAGKTTVTLALLAALGQRFAASNPGAVQAFKVGPDYIDPMFHHYVTGRPSYNLDPIITSESYVQQLFNQHSRGSAAVVVEGVMGLFDGADSATDTASTAHIARLLDLPILLVIDCSRLSRSVAAIVHGYRSFDPRLRLAGVVLNRVGSDRHLELLQGALEPLNIEILGVLRRDSAIAIPDRHLGLIPTAELPQLKAQVDQLAELGKRCFNWSALLPLVKPHALKRSPLPPLPPSPTARLPRIALAADPAFSFYYPDNLEILESLGAQLVPWSPLNEALPAKVSGLYFGGGFPEVFAEALANNQSARSQVKGAIAAGMPTYAECGGLMYLCQSLIDFEGRRWPMVGALPTDVQMGQRLTLGYRRASALQPSFLVQPGEPIWGHEFHRSTLTTVSKTPLYNLQRYNSPRPYAQEGWRTDQVHASYVHLHWGGCPQVAQRFVAACRDFMGKTPS